MPQYIALIYGAERPDDEGTPEEQQQMMNEYMEFGRRAESVLRGGEALNYTSTAKTVRVEGGKGGNPLVTDGPFAETKEALGGFYIIEAADIPQPFDGQRPGELAIDYLDADSAANAVAQAATDLHAAAILALDDSATLVASQASLQAGLPHNDPGASLAARDKLVMRRSLQAARS